MNSKAAILSVLGGVIVTLLAGLIPNTPSMLVGATHYGYPIAWLVRLVLAPQYFPWRINVPNLIVDTVICIIIVGMIIGFLILTKARKAK